MVEDVVDREGGVVEVEVEGVDEDVGSRWDEVGQHAGYVYRTETVKRGPRARRICSQPARALDRWRKRRFYRSDDAFANGSRK